MGQVVRAELVIRRKIAERAEGAAERERMIEHLLAACARRAYRIARDLLGDAAEAEDAVQEALARACVGAGQLRDPAALEGWFYRVLTNHCMRTLRRRRWLAVWARLAASDAVAQEPLGPGADQELAAARQNARLLLAVDRLPPMQKAAVVLRYGHDCSVDEVADLLGLTAGTVKTHLVRGLRRLRGSLEGDRR